MLTVEQAQAIAKEWIPYESHTLANFVRTGRVGSLSHVGSSRMRQCSTETAKIVILRYLREQLDCIEASCKYAPAKWYDESKAQLNSLVSFFESI